MFVNLTLEVKKLDDFYKDNEVVDTKDQDEKTLISYADLSLSDKLEVISDLVAFNKAKF